MEKQKKRFEELEGLRGLAAVVVVLYHFLLAFYIVAFLGPGEGAQHTRFEDNLYGSPFMGLFSGTFMVAIFFVLSGFVLSIGYFQTGKASIVKKLATKRYLRLMIPALASIIIAFLLLSAGLAVFKNEAALITGSHWLAGGWWAIPNFFEAIQSGMFGIFTHQSSPYNNVLWTMVYEFAGSFVVFGSLLMFGKLKYRWVFYLFLSFATFNTWFFAFIVGMVMADLYASGYLKTKKYSWRIVLPALLAVLFLGAFPHGTVKGTIYQYVTFFGGEVNWLILHLVIASAGAVALVLLVQPIGNIFKKPIFSKLGKYTFALYLIHLSILYTIGMAIFLLLNKTWGIGYNWSALLTIIFSIPFVAAATILFERYIDGPAIRFSSYVANVLLGYQALPDIKTKVRAVYLLATTRVRRQPKLEPEMIELDN